MSLRNEKLYKDVLIGVIGALAVWIALLFLEILIPSMSDTIYGIPLFYDMIIGIVALILTGGSFMFYCFGQKYSGTYIVVITFFGILSIIYFFVIWLGAIIATL